MTDRPDRGRDGPGEGSGTALTPSALALLASARRATLATEGPDGRPRPVPVCFVIGDVGDSTGPPVLYSPLDEKAKQRADPHRLARVGDLLARPRVAILADRWDEDWGRLGWLRLDGLASLVEPDGDPATRLEHGRAVRLLRAKYPQYAGQALEARPLIRIAVTRVLAWGAWDPDAAEQPAEMGSPGKSRT